MKCRILKPLKADCNRELNPGDLVDVPQELAIQYIEKGKLSPIERLAYKIFSEILQEELWVIDTDEDMHSLRQKGIAEAIYTADEIKKLRGIDRDGLKAIHNVKEVFEESKIEKVKIMKKGER
jgi:hypothetical protein